MELDANSLPSDEDDYHFSQLDSQVPYTQIAQEALAANTRSHSRLLSVASAPPSPEKASSESTSFATSSGRVWSNNSFPSAGKDSKMTFCFDVAHRDVLALKSDALAVKLHGGAAGAKGIQARKFAPEMVSGARLLTFSRDPALGMADRPCSIAGRRHLRQPSTRWHPQSSRQGSTLHSATRT